MSTPHKCPKCGTYNTKPSGDFDHDNGRKDGGPGGKGFRFCEEHQEDPTWFDPETGEYGDKDHMIKYAREKYRRQREIANDPNAGIPEYIRQQLGLDG